VSDSERWKTVGDQNFLSKAIRNLKYSCGISKKQSLKSFARLIGESDNIYTKKPPIVLAINSPPR